MVTSRLKQNNEDDDTTNDIVTDIVGQGDECDGVRVFSATAINCLEMELSKFSYIISVRDAKELDVTKNAPYDSGIGSSTGEVKVEPGKTYTVAFTAFDDCGNSATDTEEYTFRDDMRPSPFVLNGLAVKLGENCEVELWAKDLDAKSFDNCTSPEELRFRISREPLPDSIDGYLSCG